MNRWCEKEINELIETIATLKDSNEVEAVFDKIFTPREINDAAKRLAAIKMLEKGDSYSTISTVLGLSAGSISKLSLSLGYGFRRTNKNALNQMKPKEKLSLPHLVESETKYKGAPAYKIKFK
jgi:TrpR-related protein YerC/YecD